MQYRRHTRHLKQQPRRRRRRGCAPQLGIFVILILALGIGIYTLVSGNVREDFSPELIQNNNENDIYKPVENNDAVDDAIEDETGMPLPMVSISTRDIVNTGYLALVNHQYLAPGDPDPAMLTSAWPTVAVSRVDDMYLHNSALRAVSEMFASARAQEVQGFFVSSAFRDFYRQAYLYGDDENGEYVMPPGHSEHQTGLAADILVTGLGMHEMQYAPEGQWLANNSYRYGLILRYPQGAEHITGINFEPWHFRYVGAIHAYYMMRRGFVLEEYILHIHNQEHFSFDVGGETHHVFFQRPQAGMIYVPYERNFTVSSDNKGGYIIWTIE